MKALPVRTALASALTLAFAAGAGAATPVPAARPSLDAIEIGRANPAVILLRAGIFDPANQMLDAAGWARGPDGIRAKGGKKMKFVFQTSANGIRQKVQAVIKQACQKAGIDLELKSVTASVFFASDVANPDTAVKFWADMQMFASTMGEPDPGTFMERFVSWQIASKANKWQGRNIVRWNSPEFDKLFRAAEVAVDPLQRAALFIQMNDLAVKNVAVIPLMSRRRVSGVARKLAITSSGWDLDLSALHDWYREA